MDIKTLKPGDKVLVECTVQAVFANSKMVMVTTRDCTEGFDAYIDEIQEPRKGHWIEQIDHEENCRTLICSNCDRPALHDEDSIWKHKFCPHCGADMREVSVKIVNRGKCMLCGKELTEGLFFCKECEAKAETEAEDG